MRKSRLSWHTQYKLCEHFVAGTTGRCASELIGVNPRLRVIFIKYFVRFTKIILDASTSRVIPIIERKIIPYSIVYSDCWRGYNALNEFKHFKINHSKLFADKGNHINGIENFWKRDRSENDPVNHFPVERQASYA